MENKLPWYRTILFKLSCLIIAIIIPSVVMYMNLYTTFQNELSSRLGNTAYREKSQVMEQFDEQILGTAAGGGVIGAHRVHLNSQ